jgi:hypothetical protein
MFKTLETGYSWIVSRTINWLKSVNTGLDKYGAPVELSTNEDYKEIITSLKEMLGTDREVRRWLNTPQADRDETPMENIKSGNLMLARRIVEMLEYGIPS